MHNYIFRALIVDDDVIVANKVAHALEREGFICELAVNGDEARVKLASADYDLLVTELRMSKSHGYALVRQVLERTTSMLVVVHTDVDIPRLTKDLIARGVDDVLFKPTNYASFAAKLKGRVVRRQLDAARMGVPPVSADSHTLQSIRTNSPSMNCLDLLVPVNDRLAEEYFDDYSDFLRVSPAAIDVLMVICTNEPNTTSIAEQIKGDPTLADELIRLSNVSSQNSSRRRISTIEEAVARLGTNLIGEIITDHLTVLSHAEV